jgi:hypothetical protein
MNRKNAAAVNDDSLDGEIRFEDARPNPFARSFYRSKNVRILAPDLLEAFPDSEAVNDALRTLVRITTTAFAPPKQKRSARTAVARKPSAKKKARA